MSVNIADLVTEYGDHYNQGSQNISKLKTQFYAPSETSESLLRLPTENTQEQGAMITQSDVLQGYQPAWTSLGTTTMKPHVIQLYQQKIDLDFTADDLDKIAKSWLGFLGGMNQVDRAQWPFVRYMLEVHILQKRDENYEQLAVYKGVYAAPVTNTPNVAGNSMMGLKYIVNKAIADGYGMTIVLGAPPTDPVAFVTYVEAFVEAIPEVVRASVDIIRMSKTLAARFRDGMRIKYKTYYSQTDSLMTLINYPGIAVKGYLSMAGSSKIFASIKNNLIEYTKNPVNANIFKIEVSKRAVSVYTDWWKGVGADDPRYVFSNDVELTPPEEE